MTEDCEHAAAGNISPGTGVNSGGRPGATRYGTDVLASERTTLASERTLLAWYRTSIDTYSRIRQCKRSLSAGGNAASGSSDRRLCRAYPPPADSSGNLPKYCSLVQIRRQC